jgi:hypothetical protein
MFRFFEANHRIKVPETSYLHSFLELLNQLNGIPHIMKPEEYEKWKAEYDAKIQKFQCDYDKQTADGFHPFSRLQMFNNCSVDRGTSHVFVRATVSASLPLYKRRNNLTFDEVDADILELCKPVWEVADNNFKGRFHINSKIRRLVRNSRMGIGDCFAIEMVLNMSKDDLDTFLMYAKLGGVDAFIEKEYK